MSTTEWVGGRLPAPMFIEEKGGYQPDIILWMDATRDLIVGSNIVHPSEPPRAITDCLSQALRAPMAGPRQRPDRVRVADPQLVESVSKVLGAEVEIETAPTPELDQAIQLMAEKMPGAGGTLPGYMVRGDPQGAPGVRAFRP